MHKLSVIRTSAVHRSEPDQNIDVMMSRCNRIARVTKTDAYRPTATSGNQVYDPSSWIALDSHGLTLDLLSIPFDLGFFE